VEEIFYSWLRCLLPLRIIISQDVLCWLFQAELYRSPLTDLLLPPREEVMALLKDLQDSPMIDLVVLAETLNFHFSDVDVSGHDHEFAWIEDTLQDLVELGIRLPPQYQYVLMDDPTGELTRQCEVKAAGSQGIIIAWDASKYADVGVVIVPREFQSIRHLLTEVRLRQQQRAIALMIQRDNLTEEEHVQISASSILPSSYLNDNRSFLQVPNAEWIKWAITWFLLITLLIWTYRLLQDHPDQAINREDGNYDSGNTDHRNDNNNGPGVGRKPFTPGGGGSEEEAVASDAAAPAKASANAGRTQSAGASSTHNVQSGNIQAIVIAAWHHLARFNRTFDIADTRFNRQQTQNIAADLATSLTQNIVDPSSDLPHRAGGEQSHFLDRPSLPLEPEFSPEIELSPTRIVPDNPNRNAIDDTIVRFNREANISVDLTNLIQIDDRPSPDLINNRSFDRAKNSLSVNFFNRSTILSNGDSVIITLPSTINTTSPLAPPVLPQPELPPIGPNPIEITIPVVANPIVSAPNPASRFSSGFFTVSDSGFVGIDYLYDGGAYAGQLGIFSLRDLEAYELGSSAFLRAVADRVVSNSPLGHIVIADDVEGAKLNSVLPGQPISLNSSDYQRVKTVKMTPGDQIGLVMIPNGTFRDWLNGTPPAAGQTLFLSLKSSTSQGGFTGAQFADANRERGIIGVEDVALALGPDKDYNDMVFQILGVTGQTNPWGFNGQTDDWLTQSLGQAVLQWSSPPVSNLNGNPVNRAPAGVQVQGVNLNFGQGQSPIAAPLSPTREPSNSGFRANPLLTAANPLTTDIRLPNLDSPLSERRF
jgi:Domain of unknown function (DUF4114)